MRFLLTFTLLFLLIPTVSYAADFALISKSTPKFAYKVAKKTGKVAVHTTVKVSKFSYKYAKKGTFGAVRSVGRFLF